MLLISSAVLLVAFLLQVLPDRCVAVRGLEAYPLPALCPSRSVLGIDCPGCGLTRSFIHLANNQWRESYAVHRLGWLLAAAVAVQIPYRLYCLQQNGREFHPRFTDWVGRVLIYLLVVNWALGIALKS